MINYTMNNNRFFILMLVVGFSGCATAPSTYQPPMEDRPVLSKPIETKSQETITLPQPDYKSEQSTTNEAIVPISPAVIEPSQQNSAVIALLDSAQQQKQQGDLQAAQTSLQRAQRIAPHEPDVYFDLAQTHLELQDYQLAEQVALKGVSIVQGQPIQLRRFWMLIAEIRIETGNISGSKKARDTASRY